MSKQSLVSEALARIRTLKGLQCRVREGLKGKVKDNATTKALQVQIDQLQASVNAYKIAARHNRTK